MSGVFVSATQVDATAAADTMTTGRSGTFSLNVPFGNYDIVASADDHSFTYPNSLQRVNVGPGQSVNYGNIQAMSPGARGVTATRQRMRRTNPGTDVDESKTTWSANTLVNYSIHAADVPVGYSPATYQIQHNSTDDASRLDEYQLETQVQTTGDSPVDIPGRFTIDVSDRYRRSWSGS